MRTILIVGIGAGHPDFLTLQAVNAMRRADVVFLPDKGDEKSGLNAIRLQLLAHAAPEGRYRLERFAVPERRRAETPGYADSVNDWRASLVGAHRKALEVLKDGETGAFLVWGDPALYDGTIPLMQELAGELGLQLEIIPGISAVQALAAAHGILLNRVGEAVTVTTGRRVAAGEADGLSNFVVMLDNHAGWTRFAGEAEAEIYWGAYLGTADQILVAGRISAVQDEIARLRAEAQARHGWIMDTYLIRRPQRG